MDLHCKIYLVEKEPAEPVPFLGSKPRTSEDLFLKFRDNHEMLQENFLYSHPYIRQQLWQRLMFVNGGNTLALRWRKINWAYILWLRICKRSGLSCISREKKIQKYKKLIEPYFWKDLVLYFGQFLHIMKICLIPQVTIEKCRTENGLMAIQLQE